MAGGFLVRDYSDGDREAVLGLCRSVFGEDKAKNMRAWMDWEISGHGDSPEPIMLVLEKDNEIIGNVWCLPVSYCAFGKVLFAYHFSSFMVDARYRFHGLHLMKKILGLPHFFYITNPTDDAKKVYKGLGFSEWSYFSVSKTLRWQKKFLRAIEGKVNYPTESRGIVEHVRSKLRGIKPILISSTRPSLLGPVATLVDFFLSSLKNTSFFSLPRAFSCAEVYELEDLRGIDELFTSVKSSYNNGIARRSAELVHWRFLKNKRTPFRVLAIHDSAGKMVAYGAFRLIDHGGLRACVLRDWLAAAEEVPLKALVGQVMKVGRKNGADFLFLDNVPLPYRPFFQRWGFTVDRRGSLFFKNQAVEFPESFLSSENGVYFTGMEGDNF